MNCYKCATPLPEHSKFCMACGADVSGEGHAHNTISPEADPELLSALQKELGDEFILEKELGRGGMAIVYLGQDTHLGRKVAIKLLPPMLTFGSGPGFIERFKREARTAATLDHPNIIPVYRVSTGGKLFWYVMKYLPGESLDALLKRDGAMPIPRTVEILKAAADALDYAHQNGVVHRDVKPANIMIDKRGRVTVTDFGIAKALETQGLTNSGATIGTPHYMAPEQCLGVGVSGASDQYSLGITAYQMLSGKLPFHADSVLELMRMHTQDPPPPLADLRPDLPTGMIAAVERALAKAAKDRFPTCADFAAELERTAKEPARRPVMVETVAEDNLGVKFVPPKPRPTPKPPSGGRTRRYVIGATVLAAVAVAAFLVVPGIMPPPQPADGDTNDADRTTVPPVVTEPRSRIDSPVVAVATRPPVEVPVAQPPGPVADSSPGTAKQSGSEVGRGTKLATNTRAGNETKSRPAPDTKSDTKAAGTQRAARDTATVVPAAPAMLTVASRPASSITINGKAAPGHPVIDFPVPAGRVTIRFQVIDSIGPYFRDTVITVAPGENRNLGRILLTRPERP